jgi:hypothetical protein
MSLSRRSFSKEFKEAAVRRLELGASIAEVARACEVRLLAREADLELLNRARVVLHSSNLYVGAS